MFRPRIILFTTLVVRKISSPASYGYLSYWNCCVKLVNKMPRRSRNHSSSTNNSVEDSYGSRDSKKRIRIHSENGYADVGHHNHIKNDNTESERSGIGDHFVIDRKGDSSLLQHNVDIRSSASAISKYGPQTETKDAQFTQELSQKASKDRRIKSGMFDPRSCRVESQRKARSPTKERSSSRTFSTDSKSAGSNEVTNKLKSVMVKKSPNTNNEMRKQTFRDALKDEASELESAAHSYRSAAHGSNVQSRSSESAAHSYRSATHGSNVQSRSSESVAHSYRSAAHGSNVQSRSSESPAQSYEKSTRSFNLQSRSSEYRVSPTHRYNTQASSSEYKATNQCSSSTRTYHTGVSEPDKSLPHRRDAVTPSGKQLYRQGIKFNNPSGGRSNPNKFTFKVMSYNVLAQNLLEDNCDLYQHCKPEYLEWEFRKENILSQITSKSPDVVCLQEVNEEHYETFFNKKLKAKGYDGHFKKRTGDKKDGCAIFYNPSRFEHVESIPVEYLHDGAYNLDRDNIALITILRPIKQYLGPHKPPIYYNEDILVCVANTHLLFNPRRGDVKLAQMMVLLAQLDKIAYRGRRNHNEDIYHPVIMCGDFNTEPFTPLYKFILKGSIQYEGMNGGLVCHKNRAGQTIPQTLIPEEVGISDQCLYKEVHAKRAIDVIYETMKKEQALMTAGSHTHVAHQDGRNSPFQNPTHIPSLMAQQDPAIITSSTCQPPIHVESTPQTFASGVLSHCFNFGTVYRHFRQLKPGRRGEPEVTTHHQRACETVDYIFYSVKQSNMDPRRPSRYDEGMYDDVIEDRLELLSYLEMYTKGAYEYAGGIPNRYASSDHVPLHSVFRLKID